MARVPLEPRLMPSQKRSRPTPNGETTPMPVITTRGWSASRIWFLYYGVPPWIAEPIGQQPDGCGRSRRDQIDRVARRRGVRGLARLGRVVVFRRERTGAAIRRLDGGRDRCAAADDLRGAPQR